MPFEKGKSGNPEGRKPNKPFLDALNRAIKQDDSKRIREAAEKLLDFAAEGEAWAIKELADRLDGKATQTMANDPENPLDMFAVIERVIIDKASDRDA